MLCFMLLWHQVQWYNTVWKAQGDVLHMLRTMTSANFMKLLNGYDVEGNNYGLNNWTSISTCASFWRSLLHACGTLFSLLIEHSRTFSRNESQGQKQWFTIRPVWWSEVVVSALASINEVNLRRARLVLRWATVSGFNSRCGHLFSVCDQPATQGQLSLPSLRAR